MLAHKCQPSLLRETYFGLSGHLRLVLISSLPLEEWMDAKYQWVVLFLTLLGCFLVGSISFPFIILGFGIQGWRVPTMPLLLQAAAWSGDIKAACSFLKIQEGWSLSIKNNRTIIYACNTVLLLFWLFSPYSKNWLGGGIVMEI